jgi:hypothetical protein
MNVRMSVSEIIKSAAGLDIQDFENLYKKLSVLRVQKHGQPALNKAESKLLSQINAPFPSEKWERLKYLDWKLELSALSEAEEIESLQLAEAYESYSIERLKNLSDIATLRQVSIEELSEQLGINSPSRG